MGNFYMTPDIYGFEPYVETPAATEAFGAMGIVFGVIAVFYLVMFAFAVVSYILQSLGMYTIAKRRGIHNPWLAWIPVIGNMWILGSISDQYQYVTKGRVRNRRKLLMGLEIALYLLLIPIMVSAIALGVGIAMDSASGAGISMLVLLLSYLALIVLSILLLVFFYIALYDLFASCDPSNATTYLVLSIFFTVAMPFFIFFSRKKDLGMPPRRTDPQPAPQPVFQPVVETPVNDAPVAEEAPIVAEAPVAEEIPVVEEPPIVEEAPVAEEPSAEE